MEISDATEPNGFRRRVVHGWAFRDLSADQQEGITRYLETGDPETLPETYKRIRLGIIDQKERYK